MPAVEKLKQIMCQKSACLNLIVVVCSCSLMAYLNVCDMCKLKRMICLNENKCLHVALTKQINFL